MCSLTGKGGLDFQTYLEIRNEYIEANQNLWLFQISAPRHFGEVFAQRYIQDQCKALHKPSRTLDPDFDNEYDLWMDGIKIEVKASRAVDANSKEPLYNKALSRNSTKPFLMNFQQLKPQCCVVFIWLAVFRDEIILWVINSQDVAEHPLFSKGEHRGNKGNEGQLHVKHDNTELLKEFELAQRDLETVIRDTVVKRPK